jgi:hypothetical protein
MEASQQLKDLGLGKGGGRGINILRTKLQDSHSQIQGPFAMGEKIAMGVNHG